MSYTVFALKWRPSNFDEIVGQKNVVSTLKSSLQKDRLANAYLFAGPRGVGKTSTARILAKALNCKEGPAVEPCGKCGSCLDIAGSRSMDVIEIDGASNTSVDDVRTLRESVKFAPTNGKFKIYIIDEVHMLSTAAFNALLKTLEEPPEFVKFIFATTHPDKIPSTVLSRCQRMDFRRLSIMEIISQLEKISTAEKINIDKGVLFAIARSSDGAMRDAESVLDQLVSFSKEKVSLQDVVSVLGLVEQDVLFEITDKIIQKDPKGALELLNSLIDEGKDTGVFLSNLVEHFRNLMIAKITKADPKLIDLPQDICERLLEQSKALSMEEIFSAFNILANTYDMSKRLDSLRIPLEVNLVRLSQDKKTQSPPLASRQHPPPPRERIIEPQQSVKKAEEEPVKPPEVHHSSVSLDNVRDVWQNIIDNLGKIKMSVATYLSEGEPFKIQGNVLIVSFPKNYSLHKESLEAKENRAIVEKNVSELLNTDLRVNFILSEGMKAKSEAEHTPFIKSALDVFGGRVIREG